MPGVIKKRTTKTYTRDIEHLVRLRTAIVLDRKIPKAGADSAIENIDKLVKSLGDLIEEAEETEGQLMAAGSNN